MFMPMQTMSTRRKSPNASAPVMLFTNARDEPNIAEWICHHLLLGFDRVVVFDHKSAHPIEHLGTFDGRVAHIRVEKEGPVKMELMNVAKDLAIRQGASWFLYLDADEFLCLNSFPDVRAMLRHFHFADALCINWVMFGSSGHVEQPHGLIVDHFTRSDQNLDKHVKTFVRPERIKRIENPHFYVLWNERKSFAITGNLCIHSPFNAFPIPFDRCPAYVAHYLIQSQKEFLRRKGRTMDDGAQGKENLYGKHVIHQSHNECDNLQLREKYSDGIKLMLTKFGHHRLFERGETEKKASMSSFSY